MGTAHSKLKGFTGAFAWFGADEIGRFLVPDDYRLFLLLCRRMYVLKQVLVGHVHNAESLDPSIPARQLNDRLRGEGDVEPVHTLHGNLEDDCSGAAFHKIEQALIDLPAFTAAPTLGTIHAIA